MSFSRVHIRGLVDTQSLWKVTHGTAAASKALVCDTNTNITGLSLTNPTLLGTVTVGSGALEILTAADALTAHSGGGQSSALALTAEINRVTTVAAPADSVKLPASVPGLKIVVINSGANSLQIFGAGTDTINDVATATGIPLPANSSIELDTTVAGKWYGIGASYTEQLGGLISQAANTFIQDATDATKQITFLNSSQGTGTKATLIFSNASTANYTLPAATDTLVGRASTDTLTNKTLTAPVINTPTVTDMINQDYVRCTGFTTTSSTTLAAVAGLAVNLTAAGVYAVELVLIGTAGASGGLKATFVGTNSLTLTSGTLNGLNYNGTTLNANTNITALNSDFSNSTAAYTYLTVKGTMTVNAAGTLTVNAAQNTSSTTPTTITAGSYLAVTRIS